MNDILADYSTEAMALRAAGKMDPELKQSWLHALRSGDFKQGHGELRTQEEDGLHYCCIGVLCELVDNTKWRAGNGWSGWRSTELPHELGIATGSLHVLADMNDGRALVNGFVGTDDAEMKTFLEIADWIEEKL